MGLNGRWTLPFRETESLCGENPTATNQSLDRAYQRETKARLSLVGGIFPHSKIMALSRITAQLQQLNPQAIEAYATRIAAGEDPAQIIAEVAKDASEAPGAVGRINGHLNALLVEDKLNFDRGVFVATEALTREEAERITVNTVNLTNDTEGVGNLGRWVLGNIATILEDQGYALGDLVAPTGMAYNTVATSARTFREFRTQRFPISFAHHKELTYAKDLPTEAKHAVLQLACDEGIALLATREIAKKLQTRVRAHEAIPDWKAAAEEAHQQINEEQPGPRTPTYGLIGPGGLQTIHRKPTAQEVEEAHEVFKISSFVKRRPAEEAGGGENT